VAQISYMIINWCYGILSTGHFINQHFTLQYPLAKLLWLQMELAKTNNTAMSSCRWNAPTHLVRELCLQRVVIGWLKNIQMYWSALPTELPPLPLVFQLICFRISSKNSQRAWTVLASFRLRLSCGGSFSDQSARPWLPKVRRLFHDEPWTPGSSSGSRPSIGPALNLLTPSTTIRTKVRQFKIKTSVKFEKLFSNEKYLRTLKLCLHALGRILGYCGDIGERKD